MSIAKDQREKKRQLGQFLTPHPIAQKLVQGLNLTKTDVVLEPSMGNGSFIIPLVEKFLSIYSGSIETRLDQIFLNNIYGVELDTKLFNECLQKIQERWGYFPKQHHLIQGDFFRQKFLKLDDALLSKNTISFDYIIGNPPFGGTIDPVIQDDLDRLYGVRDGEKIKKETYSFFIVKSLDLLSNQGRLLFICSDTFLTIKTMRGLRKLLMNNGEAKITTLEHFSAETNHPMVVLDFSRNGFADFVSIDNKIIFRDQINLTGNFSWKITADLAKYFNGPVLGDYMIASSGMTIGKNEYFIREINKDKIVEHYEFEFYEDPITLQTEIARSRLGKLSSAKTEKTKKEEVAGATRRNIKIHKRNQPLEIQLPSADYCYYNKGSNKIVYAPPTHVVFWKDDGDAVLTFKKNGNWYLRGVGGQRYFKREGLTWQLIAQNLHTRFLPQGYILDSGSPCAFLRHDVEEDELYFILGWTLTKMCNLLLKEVINHTKNIQSKDFEKLPYPFWVPQHEKREIVSYARNMVIQAMAGKKFSRQGTEMAWLDKKFEYGEGYLENIVFAKKTIDFQLRLFEKKEKFSVDKIAL